MPGGWRGALGPARPTTRAARLLAAVWMLLLLLGGAASVRAAVVSTNTMQALMDAMAQGGLVTFAQDGTITFTNTIYVTNQVQLDASGHSVTLSGNNAVQLFRVRAKLGDLALSALTLTGGRNTNGGALYVEANASAELTNCVVSGNTAGASLTNVANLGFTNPAVVLSNTIGVPIVTTNFSTNTLIFDPFSSFFLTNTFTSTQTTVETNNWLAFTNTVPTPGLGATNVVVFTNTVTFTNVMTTTNITLVTNAFDTLLGTNMVVDTRTTVEQDTNFVTNIRIPATHVAPAPGSDGATGSDSSSGRGGGGGNGRAGVPGLGGAIFNRGKLSLVNCTVSTNSAIGGNGGKGGDGGFGDLRGGNGGSGGKGNNAFGGAVYNDTPGQVLIQNCTLDHNTAASGSGGSGGSGGAVGSGTYSGQAGVGGVAGLAYGGALYSLGRATVLGSTFSSNQALGGNSAAGGTADSGLGTTGPRGGNAFGGAVYNAVLKSTNGVFVATNCTFFANAATGGTGGDGGPGQSRAGKGGDGGNGAGGGLYNARISFVVYCTFWQNSAAGGTNGVAGSGLISNINGSRGAARGGDLANAGSKLVIANSIIGATTGGRDAFGPITDTGYNIWSDKSVSLKKLSHSKNGTDPLLGSFGAFGGPTLTISFATNSFATNSSPALNFIPPASTVINVDQRGVTRPQGTNGFSDAGAVEQTDVPILLSATGDLVQTNGDNVTFRVSVAGSGLYYQWRRDGVNIGGATSATYTLTNVTPANVGAYDVLVTNQYGGVSTAPGAYLTVYGVPPAITSPPKNRLVLPGTMAGLQVAATGSPPLSYQWALNGTNLAGATSSTLIFSSVSAANAGSYTVVVTNFAGAVTSDPPAVLTLGAIPSITVPPVAQSVPLGSNATFSVTATGVPPPLYQWQFNGTNLSGDCGTNFTSLTITNAQLTDAGPYSVVLSNVFGSITSAPVALSVLTAPVISVQPVGRTVLVGSNVTFSVAADGQQPLSYQWRYNTLTLQGETSATHVCLNVQTSDSGTYDVVITNVAGAITSSPAVLTVLTPVSLSGRLTAAVTATPMAGVTVNLTNQAGVLSTNTDASGYYVFTNLWPGSTNTVFPVAACQVFQPAFTNVVLPAASDATADFVGLTNNGFSIQGQITNGLSGISGVSLQLTNASGSQTVPSDGAGYYAFSLLCPDTYTVTPSAPGYLFAPVSRSVSVGPDANQVNFAAIPVFTVTGRVTDAASGNGLGGVTVYFNGITAVQTDANGYFTQTNLLAGNYTLSPVLSCYRFSPPTASLAVGGTGANTTNFVASNEAYQLGGWFNAGTNTLAQFTLTLVGANRTNSLTVTNGTYAFTNLCPGTYTVAVQPLGCYQFNPANHTVAVGPDNTALNFTVVNAATVFSASGRITILGSNAVAGVTVATAGTNVASSASSDTTGAFHLVALCPGVYQLVPELAGYQFSPPSRQVALGANTDGLDFAALPLLTLSNTNGSPAQISFPTLPGLTYTLTASSNLLDWLNIFTTNVDATNVAAAVLFLDSGSTQAPVRFYRLGDAATASTNTPAVRPPVAR